jgi:hypothetical protein
MLEQMKKTMKQMKNLDEDDAKRMSQQMKNGNYSGFAQPKMKNGKGKGKAGFHY